MKKPEMILFDFGRTLMYSFDMDPVRGERAVFQHVTENPDGVTPEAAAAYEKEVLEIFQAGYKLGYEIHNRHILKCKYDKLGLSFDIPMEEVEKVHWNNSNWVKPMPHAAEILQFLREKGIRTGVISTMSKSAGALEYRLQEAFPEHSFEFVMTSSEYGVKKPNSILFEIALKKAGLEPDKIWYCGDSIKADVYGSHQVGIFPVLYECETDVPNP